MNINKIVKLLIDLRDFLNSRQVSFSDSISELLNEITSVQTDSEKMFILNSRDTRTLLQGGMGSLNDLIICKSNGHITDDEEVDGQELDEYRNKLRVLFPPK